MFKIDYNAVYKKWEERKKLLTDDQIRIITAPIGRKENLLVLKRSRREVKDGDIFVLSPIEGTYFYGKVLMANIKNPMYNGYHVIFIFRNKSDSKDINNYIADYDNILCGPVIVEGGYWRLGYFETIGNIPLTEEEKNLDYGFLKMDHQNRWGVFKNANDEILDHFPKFYDLYGVATHIAIYWEIKREAIIDPNLLGTDEIFFHKDDNEDDKKGLTKFEKDIEPFLYTYDDDTASVCLNVGEYGDNIFKTREDEGFIGNGFDWESLY